MVSFEFGIFFRPGWLNKVLPIFPLPDLPPERNELRSLSSSQRFLICSTSAESGNIGQAGAGREL